MNIHQEIATVVDAWSKDNNGKLPARLQVSNAHLGELGFDPTFPIGDTSIPIDYVDMEVGAVRCLDQEMSKAFVEANPLPNWARPSGDRS